MRPTVSHIAIVAVALILAAYIGYLIQTQYRAQLALQRSMVRQVGQESEGIAATIGYFFNERTDDLNHLVESRELGLYFENLALGMSMEYGLKASVVELNQYFLSMQKNKQFGKKTIYDRIVFIDSAGKKIADTLGERGTKQTKRQWKDMLAKDSYAVTFHLEDPGPAGAIVLSMPYFFKAVYAGQILAWIPSGLIYDNFLGGEVRAAQYPAALLYQDRYINLPAEISRVSSPEQLPLPSRLMPRQPLKLALKSPGGPGWEYVVVFAPVLKTPFSLVTFIRATEQFDSHAPAHLLYTTGSMAAIIFAGLVFLYLVNARNTALAARLQETRFREQAIAEKNLDLQAEIAERQIAEQKMSAAMRAAEAANRAKSDFLARMSHEIRTPMNAIMGFSTLLRDMQHDQTQSEYTDIIYQSSASLLRIINDILDLSKIESGKLDLDEYIFHPGREFESTMEVFSAKAVEKQIDLIVFLDPEMPEQVTGDSLRIKQVLINLIGNAIKFTPEGGYVYVEIRLDRTCTEEERCCLQFSVSDNGIGIETEKQEEVFKPFSQADSSVTRQFGGTGLGLSISNYLVTMMGGKILLDSAPGKGSRFSFSLKLRKGQDTDTDKRFSFSRRLNVGVYIKGSTVPSNTRVTMDYLESFGYGVVPCDSPDDLKATGAVDALIVDLGLLGPDTLAVFSAFREIPVIAVSRRTAGEESAGLLFPRLIFQPLNPSKLFNALPEVVPGQSNLLAVEPDRPRTTKPCYNARALVAEDNRTNQLLIKLILSEMGIETDIAENGCIAVEKRRAGRYDIIFMDVHMPLCTGVEATARILEYERNSGTPHIPIVALTANAIKGDRESFLAGGMDGYLSKPIDRGALEGVLEEFLTAPARQQDTAESPVPPPAPPAVPAAEGIMFDVAVTAEDLGISPEAVQILLSEFLLGIDDDLEELRAAALKADRGAIVSAAHRIKGVAGNLRIVTVSHAAGAMETAARDGAAADFRSLYEAVERAVRQLEA